MVRHVSCSESHGPLTTDFLSGALSWAVRRALKNVRKQDTVFFLKTVYLQITGGWKSSFSLGKGSIPSCP